MDMKDKIILITGSSSGIGRETAKLFAEEGSNVIITYHRGEERGKEVKRECEKRTETLLLQLDVTDEASIQRSKEKVRSKYGRLDVLVNNAGILRTGGLRDLSSEEIEEQVYVNLTGLILTTKIFLPLISEGDDGMIINISSGLGKRGIAGYSIYSATKFGVRGFTQSIADELPPGVKTYIVNPSMTATRMTDHSGMDPKKAAEVIVNTAKGKYRASSGADIDVRDHV